MIRFYLFITLATIALVYLSNKFRVIQNFSKFTIINRDRFLFILPSCYLVFHQTIFKFSNQIMPAISIKLAFVWFCIWVYREGLYRRGLVTSYILFIFIASNFVALSTGQSKEAMVISILHCSYFLLFSCLAHYLSDEFSKFTNLLSGLKISLYFSIAFGLFEVFIKGFLINGLNTTIILLTSGAKDQRIANLAYNDHGQLVTMLTGEGLGFASFYVCFIPYLYIFSKELTSYKYEQVLFSFLGVLFLFLIGSRGPILAYLLILITYFFLFSTIRRKALIVLASIIFIMINYDNIQNFYYYLHRSFTEYEAKIIPVFGVVNWDHSIVEKLLPVLTFVQNPLLFIFPRFNAALYNDHFGVFGLLGLIYSYSPLILLVFFRVSEFRFKKTPMREIVLVSIPYLFLYIIVSYAFVLMIAFGTEYDKVNSIFTFFGGLYFICLKILFIDR